MQPWGADAPQVRETPARIASLVTHAEQLVMVLGEEPPIIRVCFDREDGPVGRDSGFLLVFSDAPLPDEIVDDHVRWLCVGCVINEHPEVGAALDLARVHGEVALDEESAEWVPLPDDLTEAAVCRE